MKIEIPTHCPCCDHALELVNSQLFCRNISCEAQLYKKLEHFAKVLSIKGLGPKSIEKLQLGDITELFYMDLASVTKALGSEKMAEKLLTEVEKAKSADLATVLASFSIPLIGITAASKMSTVINTLDEITSEACKEAGLGEKATANLMEWFSFEYQELKEFLPFSFDSRKRNADGETVCITGKLSSFKTKNEAYKKLEDAGFKIVESVTKTTNYLVDEEGKDSTKRKSAVKYGIRIISNLPEFLNSKEN